MGTQLSTEQDNLNTTIASQLVVAMCSAWFNQERDTDSDGYHQTDIHVSSVAAADMEIPRTCKELRLWYRARYQPMSDQVPSDEDLMSARGFLARAARDGLSIGVSF